VSVGARREGNKHPYLVASGLWSRLSDDERLEIIRRVQTSTHDDNDLRDWELDTYRANQKIAAAVKQLSAPDDERSAMFSRPDLSAASAMASVEVSIRAQLNLAWVGASAKRAHKKAGLGRHSEFNDPETAERYKARRSAWQEIDKESDARGAPRLKGRPLAEAIARASGHPFNTVRTWIREENKRRQSAARQFPRIVPGDWGSLGGLTATGHPNRRR
jgi:hypothetical protein